MTPARTPAQTIIDGSELPVGERQMQCDRWMLEHVRPGIKRDRLVAAVARGIERQHAFALQVDEYRDVLVDAIARGIEYPDAYVIGMIRQTVARGWIYSDSSRLEQTRAIVAALSIVRGETFP